MKKYLSIALLMLAAIATGRAQQVITFQRSQDGATTGNVKNDVSSAVLGTAELEVAYDCKTVKYPKTAPDKITEDHMILQTGKGLSKFYSYTQYQTDSLIAVSTPEQIMSSGRYRGGASDVVYVDYPEGKITCTDRIMMDYYLYEEDMPRIDWKIGDETREVGGYTCQRADASFRGRQWTAWFTPEIPVNAGPWKLRGLPGLILAAEDSEGQFRFEAVGIHKSGAPITMPEHKYIKTSRDKFLPLEQRYRTNPIAFMSSDANVKISVKNVDGTPVSTEDKEFNPIERGK